MLFVNSMIDCIKETTDCSIEDAAFLVATALKKADIIDSCDFIDYCRRMIVEEVEGRGVTWN